MKIFGYKPDLLDAMIIVAIALIVLTIVIGSVRGHN